MTKLSINLNKIALLRNSRGRDFPNIIHFAQRFIALGVEGITVHPRPDERHIRKQDVYDLSSFLKDKEVEFNVEGYPSEDFLRLVEETQPTQCTLVPDTPGQLTSDHGWDVVKNKKRLQNICSRLEKAGVRSAIFLDPEPHLIEHVVEISCDRIELYTESYAAFFGKPDNENIFSKYLQTAKLATSAKVGVNAGHDLDSLNLAKFLTIPDILEVSIGHVLTIECIERGMEEVVKTYLEICTQGAVSKVQ